MTIEQKKNGSALLIALEGRLDTMTAPQLEAALKEALPGVEALTFDLSKLDYISSAGERPEDHEPAGDHEGEERQRDDPGDLRGHRLLRHPDHRIRSSRLGRRGMIP